MQTEDTLWAVVMTTQPSKITLNTTDSDVQTFNVQSGVTKLSIPLTPGGSMHGKIERNGVSVVELHPAFTFEANPATYNFNAFVAMAAAGNGTVL
jgi:glucan endo-1,3-alpha-glucosidase